MDEQQLQSLIESVVEKLTPVIDSRISGYAAKNDKRIDKIISEVKTNYSTPEQSVEDNQQSQSNSNRPTVKSQELELQAMRQRVEVMEKEREREKIEAKSAKQAEAILSQAGKHKVIAPSIFKEVVMNRVSSNLQEENGKWFIKQGDTVQGFDEYVSGFLSSDEGQVFVASSASSTNGAGSTSASKVPTSQQPAEATWNSVANNLAGLNIY